MGTVQKKRLVYFETSQIHTWMFDFMGLTFTRDITLWGLNYDQIILIQQNRVLNSSWLTHNLINRGTFGVESSKKTNPFNKCQTVQRCRLDGTWRSQFNIQNEEDIPYIALRDI